MPHFSKELLDASPEALATLREILHGPRQSGGRPGRITSAPAAKEGRFVGGNAGREAPVRKRRHASLIGA
ncbi:hypothetical protein HNR00_002504 [Methylorubrum rhodinum]|jgi:hypothetical protein|uniref:Uncharacterized protein n=1 Tax=Methylorubrum rhodinum TaxID=29428 RepID=A0A840ZL31_9HYPH|nr:hypothetical protein [Methylorubrum rhodinum]MBB5757788.1 hypothetical protein [Methylorubrum rhodinum]